MDKPTFRPGEPKEYHVPSKRYAQGAEGLAMAVEDALLGNTAHQTAIIAAARSIEAELAKKHDKLDTSAFTPQEQRLYDYMQARKSAAFEELIDAGVFGSDSDDAIKKAVGRLNQKLVDSPLSYSIKNRSVVRT